MPVLKDYRLTKEITLPSFPDSKVVIFSGILIGDSLGVELTGSEADKAISMLPKIIKEWNFTNEDGSPKLITKESVALFSAEDAAFLMEAFVSFTAEQKKN